LTVRQDALDLGADVHHDAVLGQHDDGAVGDHAAVNRLARQLFVARREHVFHRHLVALVGSGSGSGGGGGHGGCAGGYRGSVVFGAGGGRLGRAFGGLGFALACVLRRGGGLGGGLGFAFAC